ncbi:MAG: hypothetical protein RIC35_17320 [Marinoscillum sp.]
MTLLRVHDLQQDLAFKFLKVAKSTLKSDKKPEEKQQLIYLQGQELGFCNDEIDVLLEDIKVA